MSEQDIGKFLFSNQYRYHFHDISFSKSRLNGLWLGIVQTIPDWYNLSDDPVLIHYYNVNTEVTLPVNVTSVHKELQKSSIIILFQIETEMLIFVECCA